MKLFVLRHGQAETFAPSDAARELTEAGRREVRQVLSKSSEELAGVSQMWVSPLVRAQQTADLVGEVTGAVARETSEVLLPESTPTDVVDRLLIDLDQDGDYLLVGHQPLLGELVSGLCGKANGYYPMDTGALARIELDCPALGCGELIWLR
ncbi:phosphohistidine phosphatase SixA [Gilvimarinus sp. F26214L]|uniref:phosphohistidine phosphatase SixA n=1 Tax=Gilvimarinus sp. DZF01 TaxID=3461371 RepID=UPI004045B083